VNQGGSAPKGDDGCTRVEAGGGWVERGEREIEERETRRVKRDKRRDEDARGKCTREREEKEEEEGKVVRA